MARAETAISDAAAAEAGALAEMSRRTGRLLRAAGRARAREGLTAEDFLIYLAIGHLGIDASGAIPRLMPLTHLQVADYLQVPRETVRRKVGRLGDRGYVQIGPGGIVVADVADWLHHVEDLFSAAGEDAVDGRSLVLRRRRR
jgi:CRP-like cAMP-binding protein